MWLGIFQQEHIFFYIEWHFDLEKQKPVITDDETIWLPRT